MEIMKKIKEREVVCSKCGYKWKTLSQLENVSCPSCLLKVKINKDGNKK
jgi:DNA-directed RNA polymerase subunit RPC12/RpoP